MHSNQRDKIFLIPEQGKNSCMMAAGNRALGRINCEEREEGGDAVWLANNKHKVYACSERGRKVTHIRFVSLPLVLHKAFRKHWRRIIRLGNK